MIVIIIIISSALTGMALPMLRVLAQHACVMRAQAHSRVFESSTPWTQQTHCPREFLGTPYLGPPSLQAYMFLFSLIYICILLKKAKYKHTSL